MFCDSFTGGLTSEGFQPRRSDKAISIALLRSQEAERFIATIDDRFEEISTITSCGSQEAE